MNWRPNFVGPLQDGWAREWVVSREGVAIAVFCSDIAASAYALGFNDVLDEDAVPACVELCVVEVVCPF